jgi:hypothetical protein
MEPQDRRAGSGSLEEHLAPRRWACACQTTTVPPCMCSSNR